MNEYQFQIVDILSDDLPFNVKKDNKIVKEKRFTLTLYGINEKKERIVCHVLKYLPYFYLKIPDDWEESQYSRFIKCICRDTGKEYLLNSIHKLKKETSKDLYGFYWNRNTNNQQLFSYLKISFTNHASMKKLIYEIKNFYHKIKQPQFKNSANYKKYKYWWDLETTIQCDCNLYESNLHPILRFIHDTNINPTGWINCKTNTKNNLTTNLFPEVHHEISCSYKEITKLENDTLSPYNIASFDIECDSLHGDFPLAKKDFKKLAIDIFDTYRNLYLKAPPTIKTDIQENCKDYLTNFIQLAFNKSIQKCGPQYKNIDIHKLSTFENKIPTDQSIKDVVNAIYDDETIVPYFYESKIPNKNRDDSINEINEQLKLLLKDENKNKIIVNGDPVIQIGTVFQKYGENKPYKRHILVIGPKDNMNHEDICDTMDDLEIEVERCSTEKELLEKWSDTIKSEDPDFITGYNIFGFDFKYIKERVDIHFPCHSKCNQWGHHYSCPSRQFYNLGKIESDDTSKDHKSKSCSYKYQKLSSSGLGDNDLTYITMDGRILFDIQKEVQKGHNLESYKLDNVASHFMRGKIKTIQNNILETNNRGHLKDGDFISFTLHSNIGEELYLSGKKFKIETIIENQLHLQESLQLNVDDYHKIEWCLNKDDITPQDIFDKHKQIEGGSKARAEVAKYCIQDCELCINLLLLLDIIPNNLAMANVSYVPASYIFLRGQGIKVTSLITKICSEKNTRIPDLRKISIKMLRDCAKLVKNGKTKQEVQDQMIEDSDWRVPKDYELEEWYDLINVENYKTEGFEGAVVLDPKPGIYLNDPVSVLDYASLYPSSIIEKNLSHETYVEDKDLIEEIGYDNLHKIEYENFLYQGKGKGDTVEKVINEEEPIKTCYFIKSEFMEQNNMGSKGIIPSVLEHLLHARSETKKRMKKEPDEFKKKVLDGLQLAYKVTANSVYGQLGATTSTIFKMNLAACTTSIGRTRIEDASNGVKKWAQEEGYEEPDVVYGDTDSVFVKFSRKDKEGKLLEGKEALQHCIGCGEKAGEYITKKMLFKPQVLEYEKTFWPFILISKKRYTGDKYEFDVNDCKRTSMGIVLKRRDNAPIVKYVFGNVIEKIMIDKNFDLAISWLKDTLSKIKNKEFEDRYFIITKSLRGYYKNPQQIAHKVLADRIAERDPGNKPKSNDRIPYAYIKLSDEILYDKQNPYKSGIRKGQPRVRNVLQGDRIEHIEYIQKHNLDIDYEFYITNQIMNPVKQVLDLKLDSKETELIFK